MSDREQRGLALAALYRIEMVDGKWLVPSQSGDGTKYVVDPEKRHCNCPDHDTRGIKCKHMFAVEFVQTREQHPDGTETVTRTFKVTEKVTYKQDWPNYNKAQTNEKRLFLSILSDLCDGIREPERASKKGQQPYPVRDMTFAIAYKVFSTVSARRFTCDLQEAATKGFIRKAPHYNSVCLAMEKSDYTPILRSLIVEASKPLRSVETQFAVDSTGFSTCRFTRWFDMKYGKTMEEREWVKVHAICGVKTNVITAAEILGKTAADSPRLPGLLGTTAETFRVGEVSADAAYLSVENVEAIAAVGGTPFIAAKETTTGASGGLFAKMFHFYCYQRDEFLSHYHKRSNIESTFSMVKAKFQDHLMSKSDTAMANEVYCKILCHNICCLIQSIYELGIEATFWGKDDPPAPDDAVGLPLTPDEVEAWAWM
jgi:transposase